MSVRGRSPAIITPTPPRLSSEGRVRMMKLIYNVCFNIAFHVSLLLFVFSVISDILNRLKRFKHTFDFSGVCIWQSRISLLISEYILKKKL